MAHIKKHKSRKRLEPELSESEYATVESGQSGTDSVISSDEEVQYVTVPIRQSSRNKVKKYYGENPKQQGGSSRKSQVGKARTK